MEKNIPNRLNEYNEMQKERAKYIERGEKFIKELFTEEEKTFETIKEKTNS